ncbi:MAG TPA: Hpt domain-containing protein [Vicinamibacterales bacterium]|nr:Hpt domain-containing protein [Vicinamibacterales bacterium]
MPLTLPASSTRVDLDDMRRRLGADDELISDLLALFLEDYPATMTALERAVRARDIDGARRGAHSLKGSASNMSAHGVVAAAAALEAAATRAEADAFDSLFATLASEIGELSAELTGAQPGTR